MANIYMDDDGLHVPTTLEDLDQKKEDWLSRFPEADTSDDSGDGRIINIFAEESGRTNLAVKNVKDSARGRAATGRALDDKCALNNVFRLPASASSTTISFTGNPGSFVQSGIRVAIQSGYPNAGYVFITTQSFTFSASGEGSSPSSCSTSGPVFASKGSITQILNGNTNIYSATNLNEPSPGRNAETDPELTERWLVSMASPGRGTEPALEAALLGIDGVTGVRIYYNRTGSTVLGIPGYNIEVVVDGGDPEEIALTIKNIFSGTCGTYGSTTIYIEDVYGNPMPYSFSRPEDIDIWIRVEITPGTKFNTGQKEKLNFSIASVSNLTEYGILIGDFYYSFTSGGAATADSIITGIVSDITTGLSATRYNPVSVSINYDSGGLATSFDIESLYNGNKVNAYASDELLISKSTVLQNAGDQQEIIDNVVGFFNGFVVISGTDGEGNIIGRLRVGDEFYIDKAWAPVNLTKNIKNIEVYVSSSAMYPIVNSNIVATFRDKIVVSANRVIVETI